MAAFASTSDVEARWRPLSEIESEVADALLEDASAVLRMEFPDIDDRLELGTLDGGVALMVCALMVKRAMITGSEGVASQGETIGPYTHNVSYANPMGNLFLTASDRSLILGRQPFGMSIRYSN